MRVFLYGRASVYLLLHDLPNHVVLMLAHRCEILTNYWVITKDKQPADRLHRNLWIRVYRILDKDTLQLRVAFAPY